MKTIQQALIDEIHYPIPEGFVENVMIKRKLNPVGDCYSDTMNSKEYMGALADCLWSLVQAINFSEADKSFGSLSDKDKERILLRVNSIYNAIGEPSVELEAKPMVYIGDCLL
ncbi:hypothetical protein [Barnesiella intestinihominis]